MRVSVIILSGLSALAAAQGTVKDATEVAASMAAAATDAAAAAASHDAAIISSQVAGQTLSGEAAAQASHNAAVLSSGLAAQTSLKSHIASVEASVLSEQSLAKASLSAALATATGKHPSLIHRERSATRKMRMANTNFLSFLQVTSHPPLQAPRRLSPLPLPVESPQRAMADLHPLLKLPRPPLLPPLPLPRKDSQQRLLFLYMRQR